MKHKIIAHNISKRIGILVHQIWSKDLGGHEYIQVGLDVGTVSVKLDDEGIVVDIWDFPGKNVLATMGILYAEMVEEDGSNQRPTD